MDRPLDVLADVPEPMFLPDKIDVGVRPIGRPVAAEVVEERGPLTRQLVLLEVGDRERECVVDADDGRWTVGERLDEPPGDAFARPVFLRSSRRLHRRTKLSWTSSRSADLSGWSRVFPPPSSRCR